MRLGTTLKSTRSFLFKPVTSMEAFKLSKSQNSVYHVEDEVLRSKTLEQVEHYTEFGEFPVC